MGCQNQKGFKHVSGFKAEYGPELTYDILAFTSQVLGFHLCITIRFWPFCGADDKPRASGTLGKHSTNGTTFLPCLAGKIPASQTGLELAL